MPMHGEEVHIVQENWAQCGTDYKAIGVEIFSELFKAHPEMKGLYTRILSMPNPDQALAKHVERVIKKFDVSISQLEKPNIMAQDLKTLGARHPGYGVIPAKHKKPMRDATFAVVKKHAGQFDETAWEHAWELITGSMGLF